MISSTHQREFNELNHLRDSFPLQENAHCQSHSYNNDIQPSFNNTPTYNYASQLMQEELVRRDVVYSPPTYDNSTHSVSLLFHFISI